MSAEEQGFLKTASANFLIRLIQLNIHGRSTKMTGEAGFAFLLQWKPLQVQTRRCRRHESVRGHTADKKQM